MDFGRVLHGAGLGCIHLCEFLQSLAASLTFGGDLECPAIMEHM